MRSSPAGGPSAPRRAQRQPQDLLGQAAVLEAFLGRQQRAGKAATARTAWLVEQQALQQEAADSEAQLWASCRAAPAAAAALGIQGQGQHSGGTAASNGLETALAAGDEGVGEALALAAAVAGLLGGQPSRSPNQPAQDLQRQLLAAGNRMQQHLRCADLAVAELLRQAQHPHGSGSGAPAAATLAEALLQLLAQHPLVAEACRAQLLEHAGELDARREQLCQQRRAAWHAFLASTRVERRLEQERQGTRPGHGGHEVACSADATPQSGSSSAEEALSVAADDSWQAAGAEGSQGEDSVLPASGSTADGWAAGEHAVFVHARRACWAPSGGAQAALVRQLAALLPARSEHAVLAHEQWHKEAGRLRSSAQQTEAGWRQECAGFLEAAAAVLDESEVAVLAGAEAAVAQVEAAAACLRSAAGVEQGQAVRGEQQDLGALAQAVAAAEAAARGFTQWQAKEDYRGRMHQLLAEHRQQREEQAVAAQAANQQAAAAAAQEAAAAAALGRQQVQGRRQADAAKKVARQAAEERREAERARREAALGALRAQVAPCVSRDAQRATAPTQSSSAAALDEPRHGLFAGALAAGFTADHLLRDQRFKVYEALRSLGLHNTQAGRQAVAAARPAHPQRLDLLTSAQRQGLA